MLINDDLSFHSLNDSSVAQEIMRNLSILYTTPTGTVPLDRDFGIDQSILDLPVNSAQAKIVAEITRKTRKYEPRAIIQSVRLECGTEGDIKVKVVIRYET